MGLKRYYVITTESGKRWGIPAEVIAKNRADYYAEIDPDTTWQEEYDAMVRWFDEKDYEFADWAKNNMDWSDVEEHAIQLSGAKKHDEIQECWVNGEYEYVAITEAESKAANV